MKTQTVQNSEGLHCLLTMSFSQEISAENVEHLQYNYCIKPCVAG